MYQAHFNLSRKPFRLSPDARFFYASKIHKNALAYLEYALDQNEGFLVLTGDPGTGKTTLLHKLKNTLSRQFYVARVDISPEMKTVELLQLIAMSFGIMNVQDSGEADVVEKIRKFLLSHLHHNHRAIVFIDECHHLSYQSLESLRLLTNIQHHELPLIQCFLVGQSSFRDRIREPELEQLSQRIIAICHLKPLCEQETEEYIQYRLITAGYPVANLFSTGAMRIIHKFTSGNPRRINRICDRALLYASIEEVQYIDEQIICDVIEELSAEMEIAFDVSPYRSVITETDKNEIVHEVNSIICLGAQRDSTSNLRPTKRPTKAKIISYPVLKDKVVSNPKINSSNVLSTHNMTQDRYDVLHTYEPRHEKQETKTPAFRLHLIKSIGILLVSMPIIYLATPSPNKLDMPRDDAYTLSPNTDNVAKNEVSTFSTAPQTKDILPEIKNEVVLKINDTDTRKMELNDEKAIVVALNENTNINNIDKKKPLLPKKEDSNTIILAHQFVSPKEPLIKTLNVSSHEYQATFANAEKQTQQSPRNEKIDVSRLKPTPALVKKDITPEPDQQKVAKISSKDVQQNDKKPVPKLPKELPSKELKPTAASDLRLAAITTAVRQPSPSLQEKEKEKKANEFEPDNLYKVINRFTGAYKGGDMSSLSSVLSEDIKTDDGNSRDSLTKQYKKLFNITDDRELKLMDVSWKTDTEKAAGEGRFKATILEKGRTKPQTYAGTFTMSIEKRNSQLAITDMRYEYQ